MVQFRRLFIIRLALACMAFTVMLPAVVLAKSQMANEQQTPQSARPDSNQAKKSSILKTQKDQVNYAIGANFIGAIKQQGIDVDLEMVMRGMKDAYAGKELQMTDGEIRKAIMIYHGEVQRKQARARAEAAENRKREGETFLAENQKKEGVVTLPSGVQYRVIKEGHGNKPADSDVVELHYRGTLINGAEFDSSFRTGHSATVKVADLIPGWREALKLMPVGSKWQVVIPPQLAYGARGVKGSVGPNETLIIEMELLAVK